MPDTPSTIRRAATAAAISTLLLGLTAGCASNSTASSATRKALSPRPVAPAAESPVSGYHTSAAALARQITGCGPGPLAPRAAAHRLQLPAVRDLASAATCTLRGRTAVVATFSDRAGQAALDAALRGRVAFYATGPGWSAASTDTSERAGQSVVQDVALALDWLVETGGA